MTVPPTFDATVDPARNLVRIRFSGDFTVAAMKVAATKLAALLPGMKRGFTMLADFSCIASMDIECAPHLTKIMDLCRAGHIGMVVRVLPKPRKDIGISILSVVHYGGEVRTVTARTLAEAERTLN